MMILQTSRGALSSGGFDRMVARYIKAVETAGATVTSTQKDALNTFFKAGKSEGWISSLRRMYFPIWGAAAPNAIDMMTVTSGTFVGGVTHGTGHVQGDGTTGYFNTNTNQAACSITGSSGYYLALASLAPTGLNKSFLGVGGAGNAMVLRADSSTQIIARHFGLSVGQITASATTANGIISFSRQGGIRTMWRRLSSSRIAIAGPTEGANSGNTVSSSIFALAGNNSDFSLIPVNFSNARIGAIALGVGVTDSIDESVTAAVKTLWETSTGLTLP